MNAPPFDVENNTGKPKHLNVVPLLSSKQLNKFLSLIKKTKKCWIWRGSIDPNNGYGRFNIKYKILRAHRLSYELSNGPLPADKVCDHLCRNRSCVNPAHIELVDVKTNVLRGFAPTAINAPEKLFPLLWIREYGYFTTNYQAKY